MRRWCAVRKVSNCCRAAASKPPAGVKQPVVAYAKAHPEVRVLDGRFMEIRQAMGTQKGREAGSRYLSAFIEDLEGVGIYRGGLEAFEPARCDGGAGQAYKNLYLGWNYF